ncbi:MAG: hypothetical protein QOH21_1921 [Acidobacteriota bacterium]|nr:hypothetical protein [Acidobacteriota bacterium]
MSATETEFSTALDLSVLLGDWRNTNQRGGIARIVCAPSADGFVTVQCFGRTEPEPRDWGTVEAPVFAFTFDSEQAGAFLAVFDLGFLEVRLQANVKAGVLVVATFNRFSDTSGRSNYFEREFFYRTSR